MACSANAIDSSGVDGIGMLVSERNSKCAHFGISILSCYPVLLPLYTMQNVVIMGSGCAGNTAAIYAARANLKPLVISGHEAGGQLSLTTLVENYPGFPEGINGPDLVENMKQQAIHFGAEYMHGQVIEADLSQ